MIILLCNWIRKKELLIQMLNQFSMIIEKMKENITSIIFKLKFMMHS